MYLPVSNVFNYGLRSREGIVAQDRHVVFQLSIVQVSIDNRQLLRKGTLSAVTSSLPVSHCREYKHTRSKILIVFFNSFPSVLRTAVICLLAVSSSFSFSVFGLLLKQDIVNCHTSPHRSNCQV